MIYAIGDIHGCAAELKELLGKVSPVPGDTVVFLGDYVDRGPDSKGVIDFIRSYAPTGVQVVALKGNHEDMMLRGLADDTMRRWWCENGGIATLESYGQSIPQDVQLWARDLPTSFAKDGYFFCHAGVNPDADDLNAQDEETLLWIRSKFLMSKKDFGARIVHGHTPSDEVEVLPNRINVDTACCFGGKLTCAMLGTGEPNFISVKARAA